MENKKGKKSGPGGVAEGQGYSAGKAQHGDDQPKAGPSGGPKGDTRGQAENVSGLPQNARQQTQPGRGRGNPRGRGAPGPQQQQAGNASQQRTGFGRGRPLQGTLEDVRGRGPQAPGQGQPQQQTDLERPRDIQENQQVRGVQAPPGNLRQDRQSQTPQGEAPPPQGAWGAKSQRNQQFQGALEAGGPAADFQGQLRFRQDQALHSQGNVRPGPQTVFWSGMPQQGGPPPPFSQGQLLVPQEHGIPEQCGPAHFSQGQLMQFPQNHALPFPGPWGPGPQGSIPFGILQQGGPPYFFQGQLPFFQGQTPHFQNAWGIEQQRTGMVQPGRPAPFSQGQTPPLQEATGPRPQEIIQSRMPQLGEPSPNQFSQSQALPSYEPLRAGPQTGPRSEVLQQSQKHQQFSAQGGVPQTSSSVDAMGKNVKVPESALVSSQNLVWSGSPGTRARRIITVESNHFNLNLGKLRIVYKYKVDIEPRTPRRFMRPVMEELRKKFFPTMNPAFDGIHMLYSVAPLPDDLTNVQINIADEDNRNKGFKVNISFDKEVNMTVLHQETIQVVNIVLRMAPINTCYPVGRSSFFFKPPELIDLTGGMEMYNGFYQSAVQASRLLLNVDVSHKAFSQSINVDSLIQLFPLESQQKLLQKFIRNLRVIYEIPGFPESKKHYRVIDLGDSCLEAWFELDGKITTVNEYFKRVKSFTLKYPTLPTLCVGKTKTGSPILLPLELCKILEGQPVNRTLTDQQTTKIKQQAATSTDKRKEKILECIQRADYNNNPCVVEFGFSVDEKFQQLQARVLEPPKIQYNGQINYVNKGQWRSDKFVVPVTVQKWTIISVCRNGFPESSQLNKMAKLLQESAKKLGVIFARPTEPFINLDPREYSKVEQFFKSRKDKFDIIFVVVPDKGLQYSWVKRAAELVVGCLTQCVKSSTVKKMNNSTTNAILLKVNVKLNGINHTLTADCKPPILKNNTVMIMGADVTHPGPDSKNVPSVAAVTASQDTDAFKYNMRYRFQCPKEEIIGDLENITLDQLKIFHKETRKIPDAVIFFRDGVSDGEFIKVINKEILAVRAACKKFKVGYEPKITFLVVQKRHHTRLFPKDNRDSEDKNNVPAGTCVDTTITNPDLQNFYLVSHASNLGVARPTKYCTLHDENNMDNDSIQELTYYLCHMFSRCTKSVSYPAPTYYAHLAAARAKIYINNPDAVDWKEETKNIIIKEEIRTGMPMFFN